MKRLLTIAAAIGLSLAAFSSCSNDPTLTGTNQTGSNLIFKQIDRVGGAGTTELFSAYARHDASNRATPLGDASSTASDINAFVTGTGARSAAISAFLQNL